METKREAAPHEVEHYIKWGRVPQGCIRVEPSKLTKGGLVFTFVPTPQVKRAAYEK